MGMTVQEMLTKMQEKLNARTGKDLKTWIKIAQKTGIDKHKALTQHLKTEHELNHNEAQWIAWGVVDPDRLSAYDRPDDLVDALYSGKKEHLRPIYDALLKAALAAGKDSKSTVCKTYTSVKTRAQFCMINPKTQSGVDLELALPPDTKTGSGLQPLKSSNPRFTHYLRLTDKKGVDATVKKWLKKAADHVSR